MQSLEEMQSMATNFFAVYASMAASLMLFRSIAVDIIPEPVRSYVRSKFGPFLMRLLERMSLSRKPKHVTLIVDEQAGMISNQLYAAAESYVRTKIHPDSERLRVHKTSKQKSITLSTVRDQKVSDRFRGFDLTWQLVIVDSKGKRRRYDQEKRHFELTFEMPNKEAVVNEYLPFVLAKANEMKEKDRAVKLYTKDCLFDENNDEGGSWNGYWGCVNLDHPSTFEKLAMDPDLKRALVDDLDLFVRRKDYYRRVGKAWKRGYLLYGPPGTGKSTLVAAMANYLKFNVYDLELMSMYSNSDLRRTLVSTSNRSIILIEDLDCSTQMHDRERVDGEQDQDHDKPGDSTGPGGNQRLTLSSLLNFIDGLWSTCGDERIIIFTTNHKEKLDPALLRPGRMDMHIHMGYCTPDGFDVLVSNYLGITEHAMFAEIKELLGEVAMTPAEVAEQLMRNEEVGAALLGVLNFLKQIKDNKKIEVKSVHVGEVKKRKKGKFGRIVGHLTRKGGVDS